MASTRTRHNSSTKLTDYLGPATDLLLTEVPTLRDILRKGLLIQEEKMIVEGGGRKNFPVKQMIDELTTTLYAQWEKSNFKFKPPVLNERYNVLRRLNTAWEKLNAIALRKETKQDIISLWESKLDKLFDITVCQCTITLCEDSDSPPYKEECKAGTHIKCECSSTEKLPLSDLMWLKGQREKTGSKSNYQMKNADMKYTKEVEKTAKRKLVDSKALEKQQNKAAMEEDRVFSKADMSGNILNITLSYIFILIP